MVSPVIAASRCLVCRHDLREEIESALFGGKSANATAKRFGLNITTLRNHYMRCIPKLLAQASLARGESHSERLLNEAEGLYRAAKDIMQAAARDRAISEQQAAERAGAWLAAAGVQLDQLPELLGVVADLAAGLAGSDRLTLSAIREARPTLELMARMIGQIKDNVTINIHQSSEYLTLKQVILAAVKDKPDAQLDIADALLTIEANADTAPIVR